MYLRQHTIQGGVNMAYLGKAPFGFRRVCAILRMSNLLNALGFAGRVKRDRFNACHEWYGLGNSREDTLETLQPQHGEVPK